MGRPKCYYVFLVPITGDLDLKKVAASVGEKSVLMKVSRSVIPHSIRSRWGSPLCTKRSMKMTVDVSAEGLERIYFSAGRVGYQIEMAVTDLPKVMKFRFADIRKLLPRGES